MTRLWYRHPVAAETVLSRIGARASHSCCRRGRGPRPRI